MSQNDMTIANQGFPATRTDINSALQALASTSSGATEPSTMFANQLWFDTAANKLKIRNEANSAWYDIVEVNESTGALNINSATIGATTAAAGAFTTLSATGVTTVQAGTAALPAITTTGDTNTGIFFPAADTIAFAEGGAEAMRINSSGNVGIGTTTPSKKLYISTAVENSLEIQSVVRNANSSSGIAAIGFNVAASGEGDYTQAGIGLLRSVANGSGSLVFYNKGSGTASNFTTADEQMRIDASGNLKFNSGYGSSATAYGCRAWVNFNGTGTVAIRGSGNVTSITDNNTGDYTVNFTTAMPDVNYSVCGASGNFTSADKLIVFSNLSAPTTSAVRLGSTTAAGAINDNNYVWAAIFR